MNTLPSGGYTTTPAPIGSTPATPPNLPGAAGNLPPAALPGSGPIPRPQTIDLDLAARFALRLAETDMDAAVAFWAWARRACGQAV